MIQVRIYLEKVNDGFVESCKCFGHSFLRANFNDNDNIIKEVIKKNPNHVNWEPPEGHGVFFD